MKRNCIIVHGCPSNKENAMNPLTRTYDKHWIPWLKKELDLRGIPTAVPLLPNPWEPDYASFKKEFEKCKIDSSTILVGHSCGTTFLIRWLGDTGKKIDILVLVAPWKIPDNDSKKRKEFYNYLINPKIKKNVRKIIYFTSNNEREDGKKSVKIFHAILGGKIVVIKGMGHFVLNDMGREEFPELLSEIISWL